MNSSWLDLVSNARHEFTPTRRLAVSYMFYSTPLNDRQYLLTQKVRQGEALRFGFTEELGRYHSLEEAIAAMQELAVADRVAHALKGTT